MIPELKEPSAWTPQAIILGKGPSADRRHAFLKAYPRALLVTLNHAIRFADIRSQVWAHFIDEEALDESQVHVNELATALLLPTVMNRGGKRCREASPPWEVRSIPALHYDRDEVGVRFLSSEGALGALGSMRFQRVLLCGVDGGGGYASGLEDLRPLAIGGMTSYDKQWDQLEKITERYGMEVRRVPV